MTLRDLRESYHSITDKASSLSRTTNYSLIAIVWILCKENVDNIPAYKGVLFWIILSLALDYLQYFLMALIGTLTYRCEERKVKDQSKIDDTETEGYPGCTPYLSIFCFVFKFVFAFIAVGCLISKIP